MKERDFYMCPFGNRYVDTNKVCEDSVDRFKQCPNKNCDECIYKHKHSDIITPEEFVEKTNNLYYITPMFLEVSNYLLKGEKDIMPDGLLKAKGYNSRFPIVFFSF